MSGTDQQMGILNSMLAPVWQKKLQSDPNSVIPMFSPLAAQQMLQIYGDTLKNLGPPPPPAKKPNGDGGTNGKPNPDNPPVPDIPGVGGIGDGGIGGIGGIGGVGGVGGAK